MNDMVSTQRLVPCGTRQRDLKYTQGVMCSVLDSRRLRPHHSWQHQPLDHVERQDAQVQEASGLVNLTVKRADVAGGSECSLLCAGRGPETVSCSCGWRSRWDLEVQRTILLRLQHDVNALNNLAEGGPLMGIGRPTPAHTASKQAGRQTDKQTKQTTRFSQQSQCLDPADRRVEKRMKSGQSGPPEEAARTATLSRCMIVILKPSYSSHQQAVRVRGLRGDRRPHPRPPPPRCTTAP